MKLTDRYGDTVEVYQTALGNVGIKGGSDLVFSPKGARKLAKALKKAAKRAERAS